VPVAIRRYPVASGASVVVLATGRAEGDLRVDAQAASLARRRRAVCDLPWRWAKQVHGARLVVADHSGDTDGAEADALMSLVPSVALAVHTADCAPVALVGRVHGYVAVAHAGWRGLVAGVVEQAVASLRAAGENEVMAYVGPCISAPRYEFSDEDLDVVARRYGPAVRARSARGTPALDLRAGVRVALVASGVRDIEISPLCTASREDDFFSHRARGELGRQALVAWRTPHPGVP
jgi:polyphenol oxidase